MFLTRRQFMKASAGTIAVLAIADKALALTALQPVIEVGNPLGEYPDRSWERVYHDQYRYDSSFTYICTPNDTHGCRVRAFVRNGVVMRVEQNYDHQTYEDLYGNRGTFAWNPRMCLKGYTFHRRVYGPYRLKGPMLRKGWKAWVDDGCPELTPEVKTKYRFASRGEDDMLRVSWDTIGTYLAKAQIKIAERYSGESGARRLREQGYPPEMIETMKGAGVRTFKYRPGMALLGLIGKIGFGRMANSNLAHLDAYIRKVGPDKAVGGRPWSSYTWHGDQPPDDPFWNGSQTSDIDHPDMRFSKLHVSWGKNFVEHKMPEAHWFIECMERGGRIVVIVPEYSPPATKADYWIPIRPASDASLFLGVIKILMDENLYDADFCKQYTDSPILVRTDTLQYLEPKDVIKDYQLFDLTHGYSKYVQAIKQEYRERLGDFMVWDTAKNKPVPMNREMVGLNMMRAGIDPALEGTYRVKLVDGKDVDGTPWSGGGIGAWGAEDAFALNLDPKAHGKEVVTKYYAYGEEPAYWNHGDRGLIVNTPKYGRKVFTGKTHMPSPTKVEWSMNVNLLNNAKYHYDMVKNVDSNVEMIVVQDLEMTSGVNYADAAFAINSWMEFTYPDMTATCSNPWVQVWKGGIRPLYDTRNDLDTYVAVAMKWVEMTGDKKFLDLWKFVEENKVEVYVQRILDASSTFYGYNAKTLLQSEKGWFVMTRTYPRQPFWEHVNESKPMWTRTGRFENYCILPEAIEYGENFVVAREDVEATPYLPSVIISTTPFVRPDDYGIPITAMHHDDRHVRNTKLPWNETKRHVNPLWEKGYQFYCITPKTRHRVHSQWSVNDWIQMYESNFGDPYRMDKRTPGVGEHQMHVNPQAAKDRGINDGDYIYADANPADRPYRGWKPSDPFAKVSRLMVRCKYNPSYPYSVTMMKHAPFVATPKSVKGHETRPDGRAIAADTGYQSNFRYGAQQSLTRSWLMPMHQTDSLPSKKKHVHAIKFGFEADNHAVNTTPKSTLVRMSKAEDGAIGARGPWEPVRTGFTPSQENEWMLKWLKGESIKIKV